jgi:mycothiol synthase
MARIDYRPVRPGEVAGWCACVNRAEAYDRVPRILSVDEVREQFADPADDLTLDTRVAVVDGEIVGVVCPAHSPADAGDDRIQVFGMVDPRHRGEGIGRALFAWAVERGRERLLASTHDRPRVLRANAYEWLDANQRLYERFGFRPVRWFEDLVRPLDATPPIGAPAGVTIEPWPKDRDGEILAARNEAFADHWGSTPISDARWTSLVRGHAARPDLSCIASEAATGAVVGACLNHVYSEDFELVGRREGWIGDLSTVRAWRGRGVASALIATSLAVFAGDGLTHAMIGVDSANPTGAARLYRSLGFEPLYRSVTYQLAVAP